MREQQQKVRNMRKARKKQPAKIPRLQSMKRRSESESIGVPRRSATTSGMLEHARIAAHIRAFGIDVSEETRNHLRKKVSRRFGKFAESIERVSIRFRDVNGPRGGVDQVCHMKVVLKSLPSVVFESRDVSLDGAFSGALTGAERIVRRSLQRRRSKPMKKSPSPARRSI